MRVIDECHIEKICGKCKCKLAVEKRDIDFNELGHGNLPSFYCKCVRCGEIIKLSKAEIPSYWMRELWGE